MGLELFPSSASYARSMNIYHVSSGQLSSFHQVCIARLCARDYVPKGWRQLEPAAFH